MLSTSTIATSTALIILNEKVDGLQRAVDRFDVAQGFFSSIIGIQTAIFSAIVAILLALYFFFNQKVSREYIRAESGLQLLKLKEEIEEEFEQKTQKNHMELSELIAKQEHETVTLTGSVYRTLGQFWDSEKNYGVAFIWWIRAAHKFAQSDSEKLTRIALAAAKEAVERVMFAYELDTESVGEYQKLLPEIADTYKIEKDLLDLSIKEALKRNPPII